MAPHVCPKIGSRISKEVKIKTLLIIIPARKGSVRVPNKNLRPIGNHQTLLGIAMNTALVAQNYIPAKCNVWVSTDYEWDDIPHYEVSDSYQYKILTRPTELCSSEATSEQVVKHAIDSYSSGCGLLPDEVMLLQPTSPLRTVADVCLSYQRHTRRSHFKTAAQNSRTMLLNGAIYIFKPIGIDFNENCWSFYEMPPERSLDIDTEEDFALADKILKGMK